MRWHGDVTHWNAIVRCVTGRVNPPGHRVGSGSGQGRVCLEPDPDPVRVSDQPDPAGQGQTPTRPGDPAGHDFFFLNDAFPLARVASVRMRTRIAFFRVHLDPSPLFFFLLDSIRLMIPPAKPKTFYPPAGGRGRGALAARPSASSSTTASSSTIASKGAASRKRGTPATAKSSRKRQSTGNLAYKDMDTVDDEEDDAEESDEAVSGSGGDDMRMTMRRSLSTLPLKLIAALQPLRRPQGRLGRSAGRSASPKAFWKAWLIPTTMERPQAERPPVGRSHRGSGSTSLPQRWMAAT